MLRPSLDWGCGAWSRSRGRGLAGPQPWPLSPRCSPADGAPLSELSWPSSLAVVAVSFSGLFAVIVLMLACLCCKKGGIGFKVRPGGRGSCCGIPQARPVAST